MYLAVRSNSAADLSFELLAAGPWSEIVASYDPTARRLSNAAIDALIAEAWASAERAAADRGGSLFPGPLLRVRSYRAGPDRLELSLGATDYREYLGTNCRHDQVARLVAGNLDAYLASPLAMSAIVRLPGSKLFFGRRSPKLAESAGLWHTIGGHADLDSLLGRSVDVYAAIRKEIHEELAAPLSAIVECRCLAFVRTQSSRKPELLFAATLDTASIVPDDEHSEVVLVDDTLEALRGFVLPRAGSFVPVGLACLGAYCVSRFGEDLFPPDR